MSWESVIGLEIHVQLATRSKLFTPAPVGFDAPPNTLVDPVVLGMPGVLPVLNREAVELAMKVATPAQQAAILGRCDYYDNVLEVARVVLDNAGDAGALADAIEAGQVAGAGLDVFEREPPVHSRLTTLPQVVAT
ncbi:MAG: NAD(P)-dependent oxidoreductase, partial [Myxococcota bacterium]|nr:NAD(P)-dependent oxidoreductase [Myxococcota bacterium]